MGHCSLTINEFLVLADGGTSEINDRCDTVVILQLNWS